MARAPRSFLARRHAREGNHDRSCGSRGVADCGTNAPLTTDGDSGYQRSRSRISRTGQKFASSTDFSICFSYILPLARSSGLHSQTAHFTHQEEIVVVVMSCRKYSSAHEGRRFVHGASFYSDCPLASHNCLKTSNSAQT